MISDKDIDRIGEMLNTMENALKTQLEVMKSMVTIVQGMVKPEDDEKPKPKPPDPRPPRPPPPPPQAA